MCLLEKVPLTLMRNLFALAKFPVSFNEMKAVQTLALLKHRLSPYATATSDVRVEGK